MFELWCLHWKVLPLHIYRWRFLLISFTFLCHVADSAGHLPELVPDQVLKLKQLTVLTLAETDKVASHALSECKWVSQTLVSSPSVPPKMTHFPFWFVPTKITHY